MHSFRVKQQQPPEMQQIPWFMYSRWKKFAINSVLMKRQLEYDRSHLTLCDSYSQKQLQQPCNTKLKSNTECILRFSNQALMGTKWVLAYRFQTKEHMHTNL